MSLLKDLKDSTVTVHGLMTAALSDGTWTPGGDHDAHADLDRIAQRLASGTFGQDIGDLGLARDLADVAELAIAAGEWHIGAPDLGQVRALSFCASFLQTNADIFSLSDLSAEAVLEAA